MNKSAAVLVFVLSLFSLVPQSALAAPKKSAPVESKSAVPGQMIPSSTKLFVGSLPSYYAPSSYTNAGFGFRSGNLMGINNAGKKIDAWLHEQRSSIFDSIYEAVGKTCKDQGFTAGAAASDISIVLDTPIESVFILNFVYQTHCW